MRKKNTFLMLVTLLISALFIGLSMAPATARLTASLSDSDKTEKVDATTEESVKVSNEGCPLCANQETNSNTEMTAESETVNGMVIVADTEQTEEPPCESCHEAVVNAFEGIETYILDNLPEFNMDDWEPFYVLEYALDARDVIIAGIISGIVALGQEFSPYLGQATGVAIGALVQALLNGFHLITAVGKMMLAVVTYFIEVCIEIFGGGDGGTNVQTVASETSASTLETTETSATYASTTTTSTQSSVQVTEPMAHYGTMSL